jgi:hypothetical protein
MLNKLKRVIQDRLTQYASRLRFPKLLGLAAAVFLVDLIFPDAIPFADEILFGLITMLLAMLKKQNLRRKGGNFTISKN